MLAIQVDEGQEAKLSLHSMCNPNVTSLSEQPKGDAFIHV